MRRDVLFYRLFQQQPELLFEFLEQPPANAGEYQFGPMGIKEAKFEPDGVFLPPESDGSGVVYFCEVQFQKDKRLYERMFAELFLFFHQNRERYGDWQAVVIYPNRATEQEEVRPYRHLLESEQVHQVYLNELGNIRQLSMGMALMVLTIVGEREAPEEARYLLERAEREVADPVSRQAIMEMVARIMSYKFSRKNLREIEAMLGIRFEETRVYQEIREDERRALVRLLLNQKFKSLPDRLVQRVNTLDLEQLERLAIGLLNFKKIADLEHWLSLPENQPRPVQEDEERAESGESDRGAATSTPSNGQSGDSNS